jgi:hypothetical protein
MQEISNIHANSAQQVSNNGDKIKRKKSIKSIEEAANKLIYQNKKLYLLVLFLCHQRSLWANYSCVRLGYGLVVGLMLMCCAFLN